MGAVLQDRPRVTWFPVGPIAPELITLRTVYRRLVLFAQHQIVFYQLLYDLPLFRSADLEAVFAVGWELYR
jgi:hypothetical protein